MIDRYTIKFGPAVSQMELEKALHETAELRSPRVYTSPAFRASIPVGLCCSCIVNP
jgi:hypothetical protein